MIIPCRAVSGGEVPAPVAFDGERGEYPGPVRAGVDPDPVRALVHRLEDRVPVNHDAAMIVRISEEGVPDPPQIGPVLLLDRDPRPDAGVNEQIVAERE